MLRLFCMSAEKKRNHPLRASLGSSVLQEMKERAPDVLDFITTISVPVVKEKENQVPPLCVAYGLMMHTRWKELSLIQKIVTFILGIGHSTAKVNSFWKLNEQNKYHFKDHLNYHHNIHKLHDIIF